MKSLVFQFHLFFFVDIKPGPKLDETFERTFIREVRMGNEHMFDDDSKVHRFTRYTLEDAIAKDEPVSLDPLGLVELKRDTDPPYEAISMEWIDSGMDLKEIQPIPEGSTSHIGTIERFRCF